MSNPRTLMIEDPLESPERTVARDIADRFRSGLCQCGCGCPTTIATKASRGHPKGAPYRFLRGHGNRLVNAAYVVTDAGYETPCWLWTRGTNADGYGESRRVGRTSRLAHRHFFEDRHGPIPTGLDPDHLCRNPACVNPDHLELVTRAVNARRGSRTILTRDQAAEIKRSAKTYKALAEEFGVAASTVWAIRSGRNWRDV
jgi:HNH endonuclease